MALSTIESYNYKDISTHVSEIMKFKTKALKKKLKSHTSKISHGKKLLSRKFTLPKEPGKSSLQDIERE